MARDLSSPPDTDLYAGDEDVTIEYISPQEAAALLDRQARAYLGMSGEEFTRRYRDGTIDDPESGDVQMLSFLIATSEE